MKVRSVADVKAKFSQYLSVDEGPVVVTRNGRPAAVLVPVGEDAEIEDLALTFSSKFREILARARAQIRRGETYSHDEVLALLEEEEA